MTQGTIAVTESKEKIEGSGMKQGGKILISYNDHDSRPSFVYAGETAPEHAILDILKKEEARIGISLEEISANHYFVEGQVTSSEYQGRSKLVYIAIGPYQFECKNGVVFPTKPLSDEHYPKSLGGLIRTDIEMKILTPTEQLEQNLAVQLKKIYEGKILRNVNRMLETPISNSRLDQECADLFALAQDSDVSESLIILKKEDRRRKSRTRKFED